MSMPQIPPVFGQERAGIFAVAAELNRLGLIWRETPLADIGVDGQIEFTDDAGRATGRLLAAQVKSGNSYFTGEAGSGWRFYPEEKHRSYWERFPLPVLLFLYSADHGTFWVDVRQALRSPERSELKHIIIPKQNRLEATTREQFLASVGASGRPFLPIPEMLVAMASTRSPSASLPVSYLDLFANGLTNVARSVYYGMDLVMEVAETLLDESSEDGGIGMGPREDSFLFDYVRFLVEQQVADVDISDCLIDWDDREIHPTFIAPLTSRGRALVGHIQQLQQRLEAEGRLEMPERINLAQETFVRMHFTGSDYLRMPLIHQFGRLISGE